MTWFRVPLDDLPLRFWKANVLGYRGDDFVRESKGYVTAAQVETLLDARRKRGDTDYYTYYARIDRRIRNPIRLGCNRGAIERVYGLEKYSEWIRTGNWLDKTEDEAMKLLWGDDGPPCPSGQARRDSDTDTEVGVSPRRNGPSRREGEVNSTRLWHPGSASTASSV